MRNDFRAWLWYAAVWVPIAALYALLISQTRGVPASATIVAGITYVVPPALLGVLVWRVTRLVPFGRVTLRFLVIHVGLAIAFTATWLTLDLSWLALRIGTRATIEIGQTFAGWQLLTGLWMYAVLAGGSYVIRIATRLREQEAVAARAESLRMQAELSALRGQLNPHFLFNTLHTLTALVRQDPNTAERALERFGDMLRYVLDVKRATREDATLAEEMEFVRNYLALEQLRLGERLRVTETIEPDAYDCVLPSLTLQPLIENAIKYGIAPRAAGGSIEIHASLEGDVLKLSVRDDGPGARADAGRQGAGVGLRAVRQRLETRYPNAARFAIVTAPNDGFTVSIALPAHTGIAQPAPVG